MSAEKDYRFDGPPRPAEIKAGAVGINDHGYSCSEMPHGGFKQSGFGKDLSTYAFDEYTNVKHVSFERTRATRKDWYDLVSHPVPAR